MTNARIVRAIIFADIMKQPSAYLGMTEAIIIMKYQMYQYQDISGSTQCSLKT